jgi:hypothetical protein
MFAEHDDERLWDRERRFCVVGLGVALDQLPASAPGGRGAGRAVGVAGRRTAAAAARPAGPPRHDRRVTVGFDRGGWSPGLFAGMVAVGFNVLTYLPATVGRDRGSQQQPAVLLHVYSPNTLGPPLRRDSSYNASACRVKLS